MNNKVLIILLIVILFISCDYKNKNKLNNEIKVTEESMDYIESIENGFVSDKETAEKIADIILTNIYGDKILLNNKPYKIKLIDDVWYIEGALKVSDFALLPVGGIPYIKIRKSDGAILGVSHTK